MRENSRHGDGLISSGITVTKCLIGINIAIYLVMSMRGNLQDTSYMIRCGALWVPYVTEGEYYRLLAPVFMHFSFIHIFNNMLLLFFMGDVLEAQIGKLRFLLLYLFTGIFGNMVTCGYELLTGDFAVSAGASGAITGVLGALLILLVLHHGSLSYLTGPRMAFFVFYTLAGGLASSTTNNAAHIGGLIGGVIFMCILLLLPHKKDTL